jgi:hypothetical protein
MACPAHLCRLYLPDSDRAITDAGLQPLSRTPRIRHLNLGDFRYGVVTNITDAGMQSLAGITALQHLNLAGCSNITDAGMQSLVGLTSLQHLNLERCSNITDATHTHTYIFKNIYTGDVVYSIFLYKCIVIC